MNSVKSVVLDASAVIAFIANEPGALEVESYLPQSIISAVNLSEVVAYLIREGMKLSQIRPFLKNLHFNVVSFDEEQALRAAECLPHTSPRGLSLADRACLGLAMTRKLPVLTGDRVWKTLDLAIPVIVFR